MKEKEISRGKKIINIFKKRRDITAIKQELKKKKKSREQNSWIYMNKTKQINKRVRRAS